jgi:hypothetical protein
MNALLKHPLPHCSLLTAHCSLLTAHFFNLPPLHFSVSAFRFSAFTHSPLNDIAINQMRTLLSASSVKRLK